MRTSSALGALLLALATVSCNALSGRGTGADLTGPALLDTRAASVADFLARRSQGLAPEKIDDVARALVVEADRAQLTPGLIVALIHVESSGRYQARSRVGALGLMQLRPFVAAAVARRIGVSWDGAQTLYDPIANVRIGVHYLAELVDRFGDLEVALAAYNWGPTRISAWQRKGKDVPTGYAYKVMDYYQRRTFGLGLA